MCPPPVDTPLLDQPREMVWPKIFDGMDPIEPQAVLDAIDRALGRDELWVFPGRGSKLSWRMRRWMPEFLWKQVHRTEGV